MVIMFTKVVIIKGLFQLFWLPIEVSSPVFLFAAVIFLSIIHLFIHLYKDDK